MTKFVVVLSALAALLVVAPATAQRPYKVGDITISASPNPVVFSSPITISGRARGANNQIILLQTSTDRTNWSTAEQARTAKNGGYSFGHRPSRNLYYRAVLRDSNVTSNPLLVRVRMLVGLRVSDPTPSRGQRVRFSGIVRPPHNGRRIYLQKRSPTGRFVTVKRTTLRALDSKSSRYSMSIRVRASGVYRTRVLGHSDHAQGISRERAVTVG